MGVALWMVCTLGVWTASRAQAGILTAVKVASTSGGTSLACTFSNSGAATAGDLLVLGAQVGEATDTIATPSGYTQAVQNNTNASSAIFYKVAAGGETGVTMTIVGGGSMPLAACSLYDFGYTSSPVLHGTIGGSQSTLGTSCTPGTLSPATSAGDVMVGVLSADNVITRPDPSFVATATLTGYSATGAFGTNISATASLAAFNWAWTLGASASCVAATFTVPALATTTTTAATTTTTAATTTTTTAATTTTTGAVLVDYSRFCSGILVPTTTTTAATTTTTTGGATTTTTVGVCMVSISGFSGDGNSIVVALGVLVFCGVVAVVLLMVRRRSAL